jgi:hypothetical protein
MLKTSLVFLYRLLMIVLLAWIAYTQTLIYRDRPVPVTIANGPLAVQGFPVGTPVRVEIDNDPVRVEVDNIGPVGVEVENEPLQVEISR